MDWGSQNNWLSVRVRVRVRVRVYLYLSYLLASVLPKLTHN